MEYMTLYIALAAIFGLFMAWGIGANDVANAMATSVGSRVLSLKQAILVAAIFEFAGAVLAGGEVTSTIRNGIVDASAISDRPELLVYGMLAALLAAGTWLLIASRKGWPVSTTHSIVGAIVGFAAVGISIEAVKWASVGTIVTSWIISPVVAGTIAFLLFTTVQKLVLERRDPLSQARRWVPVYMFFAGFLITLVTLFKGLKHVGVSLSEEQSYLLATIIGLVIAIIGKIFISRIKVDPEADRAFHFATVEKVFGVLMVLTACTMAFAHGSNDVANAVGPVAAVISVASSGEISQQAPISFWVLLLGGIGIVVGLATFGKEVMKTVGEGITHLTPSRGFAAELAAATTIVVASGTGLPVSTTHTLVGAVLGVGIARGIAAINLAVVRDIFMSWIITVPAGAVLAIIFFFILRVILG
ncbi:MAG TPA: inorganic phosphate transporter [Gammaproteobacteria bacterium]|nr:inorganic phosphate transporter [Gammaproteobacteria bacterium]